MFSRRVQARVRLVSYDDFKIIGEGLRMNHEDFQHTSVGHRLAQVLTAIDQARASEKQPSVNPATLLNSGVRSTLVSIVNTAVDATFFEPLTPQQYNDKVKANNFKKRRRVLFQLSH